MSSRKRPRGRPSKYPPEFQRDAVAMVLDEGRAIAEVGRAIGVNEGTLGNWVAKARRERSVGVGLNDDERAELGELRAEATQLRMERDLLKRSIALPGIPPKCGGIAYEEGRCQRHVGSTTPSSVRARCGSCGRPASRSRRWPGISGSTRGRWPTGCIETGSSAASSTA